MAKSPPKTKKSGKSKRSTAPKPDFHRQLILAQWALSHFGVGTWEELKERFQIGPNQPVGLDPESGLHHAFMALTGGGSGVVMGAHLRLPMDVMQGYEDNIRRLTESLSQARVRHGHGKLAWTYHQYLALFFSELFFDRYFDDPAALRDELNERIRAHNAQAQAKRGDDAASIDLFPLAESPARQLARLAFWCATGSGKTLLGHAHILQFRHWHARALAAGKVAPVDQVILLTPNEGLTRQHLEEFKASGIPAFGLEDRTRGGLFGQEQPVLVMEITKLTSNKKGDGKSVDVESFEGRNLVLVDEGHRGVASEDGEWMQRRDQLTKQGFTIEYSATLGQAVAGSADMTSRYARSILFDYAYRHFYRDGYGKDFAILNLEADREKEDREYKERYLTGALLCFYQQMRVFESNREAVAPFLLEKPLWVFVGHTVTGKVSSKDDKTSESDVVKVLTFFARFLADPAKAQKNIQRILAEGLSDGKDGNVLAQRLPLLETLPGDKAILAKEIHADLLKRVFHASDAGVQLSVQVRKGADGELAVYAGNPDEPFGVVNVGDPAGVADLCAKEGICKSEDDLGRKSLFQAINRQDSPVNLLVGSRKFTEGWNSFRVSCLGLMHLGKGEGTQIIQLFGRGVRLKGHQNSMRRSAVLPPVLHTPKHSRQLETLQVFGVEAHYMAKFRDYIFSELPEAKERHVFELDVLKTLPKRKLKTLRVAEEINGKKVNGGAAFKELGPLYELGLPQAEDVWLKANPVTLDWRPRVIGIQGQTQAGKAQVTLEVADEMPDFGGVQKLREVHLATLDRDELVAELEIFKAQHGLLRVCVTRKGVDALLDPEQDGWYDLKVDGELLLPNDFGKRTQWQRVALELLKKYTKRFHDAKRAKWEQPYLEAVDIDETDPNFPDNHTLTVEGSGDEVSHLIETVKELSEAVEKNKSAAFGSTSFGVRTVPFAGHLYQPLLYVGKHIKITASPVALNGHETRFVTDLAAWCEKNARAGREIHLLRNQAKTGLGFFQAANFYPDFLLWLSTGDKQQLVFVDPKGMLHIPANDPKVLFAKNTLPGIEAIIRKKCPDLSLHAYLISNTSAADLGMRWGQSQSQMEANGVLFQSDVGEDEIYIARIMKEVAGWPGV